MYYVSMVINSGVFLTNFIGLGLETACPGIGHRSVANHVVVYSIFQHNGIPF